MDRRSVTTLIDVGGLRRKPVPNGGVFLNESCEDVKSETLDMIVNGGNEIKQAKGISVMKP